MMSDKCSGRSPLGRLDEDAATKGYLAVPLRGFKIALVDNATGASKVFESHADAHSYVKQLNRELPDITPSADVPIEAAGQLYTASTQGANTFDHEIPLAMAALEDLDDAVPLGIRQGVESLRETGNLGKLRSLVNGGFSKWLPARRYFSMIDQHLFNFGMDTGLAGESERLITAVDRNHMYQEPFHEEAARITAKIRKSIRKNGTFARVWETEDPAERAAAAHLAGFTPGEYEALDDWKQFYARLFPETGLAAERKVLNYMPHIAQRQSFEVTRGPKAYEGYRLDEVTEPFYKHARTGKLNARELDPAELADAYIRALGWRNHVEEPYKAMLAKWQGVAKLSPEMEGVANPVLNWLDVLHHGYNSGDDIALATLHSVMKGLMGPQFSERQTKEVFNFGMNTAHGAMLGFRPHVMARDALQLLLAVPRAGGNLREVLHNYSTDGAYRTQLWQDAAAGGAIQPHARITATGGSGLGELEAVQSVDPNGQDLPKRAQLFYKLDAAFSDLMPPVLKGLSAKGMYLYGKQGELMRALIWKAGAQKATRALKTFRTGREGGRLLGDFQNLLRESGASTFDPAWQREFGKLVASGNDAEAASFLGRQLTRATQFDYGTINQPGVSRTVTGRIGMQFGNYPIQLRQYAYESLRNGSAVDKAKFLGSIGLVSGLLAKASSETGWNFNPMNPYLGFMFGGGPGVEAAADIGRGISATGRMMVGQETQATDREVVGGVGALGTIAGMLNPVGGLVRDVRAWNTAMQSPLPGHALLRAGVTGQIDNAPDVTQVELPQAQESFQRSVQALHNPVNWDRSGTLQIPQQQVVMPPEVSGPPNMGGYSGAQNLQPARPAQDPMAPDAETASFLRSISGLPPELHKMALDQYYQSHRGGYAPQTSGNQPPPGVSKPGGGGQF